MSKTFLQAEWRKLVIANYALDQKTLEPYLPYKTEFDLWKGTCYVSLVGFMFENTTVKGFRMPFHTRFEEVNLRFYVRYRDAAEWKRGVVFIKEIVPKPALTWVANTIYGENYETMPMDHLWEITDGSLSVAYKWKKKRWNSIQVTADPKPHRMEPGSEAEFIAEHYWGYTKRAERRTSEYQVEHPSWQIYDTKTYSIDVDFGGVYGRSFEFLKNETPLSVFLAEGSEIEVKEGKVI